ncbi:MAG: right-handed parallel beta-helix repeat-containing protein [Prevotellaceae bacterium]|jgi:hypothetical protein|nr:right-handed parallel beta-helix repeat-containing protein [Prevotellaceae bacterium]
MKKAFLFNLVFLLTFAMLSKLNGQTLSGRGASMPFSVIEAENASTNATILPSSTVYKNDIQSEASGRRAVKLQNTADYVQFTLTASANALVLRYAIPDNNNATYPLAFYINGSQQSDLTVDSKHSWVYGNYPYTDNANDGNAHKFWEEKRIILPQTYTAGTTLKFQKNSNCNASWYCIDLIESEQIPAATAQPANSISVSSYTSLQTAVDDAIHQGKSLYIPEGEKNFPTTTDKAFVWGSLTIQGAGAWRSIISGKGAQFVIKNSVANITFKDFTIRGVETCRIDNGGQTAIESEQGYSYSNVTIDNIWVEHCKVGFWIRNCNNLNIKNCRIRNVFADGINLNNGNTNAIIEHNHIRNTGDDGIALWSKLSANGNNKIRYNTVSLPSLANGIAIYGGYNNEISNNLITDIVFQGAGVNVGTDHQPISCNGYIKVLNNTLLHCGSIGDYGAHIGAVWICVPDGIGADISIEGNDIYTPRSQGIFVKGAASLPDILVKNNVFHTISTNAIHIMPECNGAMTAQCNTFTSCNNQLYKESSSFVYNENNSNCESTPPPPVNILTIKIKVPEEWTNCYAHLWWADQPIFSNLSWPGQVLTKEGEFFVYTVDIYNISNANLIFNNGSGAQTEDMSILRSNILQIAENSCWDGTNTGQTPVLMSCTVTGISAADENKTVIYVDNSQLIINSKQLINSAVQIFDVTGKIIATLQQSIIDINYLPAGIYFVKIGNYTEKFIKK